MDLPIIIIWGSPLSFLEVSGGILNFIFHFSMKILLANSIAADRTPGFVASNLGLYFLPMSHEKTTGLYELRLFLLVIIFMKNHS